MAEGIARISDTEPLFRQNLARGPLSSPLYVLSGFKLALAEEYWFEPPFPSQCSSKSSVQNLKVSGKSTIAACFYLPESRLDSLLKSGYTREARLTQKRLGASKSGR